MELLRGMENISAARLLYKYCVSHMAWTSRRVAQPDDIELTERQKILFREPADPHRHFPSLF